MTKLTLPWTRQGRFLRTLAKTGNVAEACRAAGLDRRLAYRWRDRDPDFARRWKEAAARANDLLRGELMERALIGRERIVYRYRPTVAHRQVRREIFGSAATLPRPASSVWQNGCARRSCGWPATKPKTGSRRGTRISKSEAGNCVTGPAPIGATDQGLGSRGGTLMWNKQTPFRRGREWSTPAAVPHAP